MQQHLHDHCHRGGKVRLSRPTLYPLHRPREEGYPCVRATTVLQSKFDIFQIHRALSTSATALRKAVLSKSLHYSRTDYRNIAKRSQVSRVGNHLQNGHQDERHQIGHRSHPPTFASGIHHLLLDVDKTACYRCRAPRRPRIPQHQHLPLHQKKQAEARVARHQVRVAHGHPRSKEHGRSYGRPNHRHAGNESSQTGKRCLGYPEPIIPVISVPVLTVDEQRVHAKNRPQVNVGQRRRQTDQKVLSGKIAESTCTGRPSLIKFPLQFRNGDGLVRSMSAATAQGGHQ